MQGKTANSLFVSANSEFLAEDVVEDLNNQQLSRGLGEILVHIENSLFYLNVLLLRSEDLTNSLFVCFSFQLNISIHRRLVCHVLSVGLLSMCAAHVR